MDKELIANLTDEENIAAIYNTTKYNKRANETYINYTIICDLDSVTEDLRLCRKIIATMEIIKELFSKYHVSFSYKIKTNNELDREVIDNRKKVTTELARSEILHCKDDYIAELIQESRTKKRV